MIFQDCKQHTNIFQQKINNTDPKFTVFSSLKRELFFSTRFHPRAAPGASPCRARRGTCRGRRTLTCGRQRGGAFRHHAGGVGGDGADGSSGSGSEIKTPTGWG